MKTLDDTKMPHPISSASPGLDSSRSYRGWLLTSLVMVYASNFMDRMVIATVGEAVKIDLQLTDLKLGLLGGLAFALFYTLLGIPIARLAERFSRVKIISACIIIWSGMTVLCGSAQSFIQLLFYRMGVGVGEAGCTPAAHSLISDHYPSNRRATALAILNCGVPIGACIGAFGGGWIVQNYGWREAFYWMGLPGIIIGLLIFVTLREPKRGAFDAGYSQTEAVPPFRTVVKHLASITSFRRFALGAGLGGFATFGIGLFIPVFLIRAFEMSYAQAGLLYALISGVGGLLGSLLGGVLSDKTGQIDQRWYGWLPAMGFLIAAPSYVFGFMSQDWKISVTFIFIGAVFVMFHQPPTFAVTQNLVNPRMRASASAILMLIINLLGMGLGPVFIGFASDLYAQAIFTFGDYKVSCPAGVPPLDATSDLIAACKHASVTGLRAAVVTCAGAFVLSGVAYYAGGLSLSRDLIRQGAAKTETPL